MTRERHPIEPDPINDIEVDAVEEGLVEAGGHLVGGDEMKGQPSLKPGGAVAKRRIAISKRISHIGRTPDLDVNFSHESTAPRAARRALQQLFAPDDRIAQDVATVASELVSNVVQHTDDGGTVRAWDPKPDVPLRLEVSDTGSQLPATQGPPRQLGGRGLIIVDALADAWGVQIAVPGPGKTVWAEFDRNRTRPSLVDVDDEPRRDHNEQHLA